MLDADHRAEQALEAAIIKAVRRHDAPPKVIISVMLRVLSGMIEEAPYSRAEKHELAAFLAEHLHAAADA